MSVITIPVSHEQEDFIKRMVKSGRAATKAHAVRMGIQLLAEQEALHRLSVGEAEVREGKSLNGDLRELAKRIV